MSYEPNTTYQENAWEQLQAALEDNDIELAERIVASAEHAGFNTLAKDMNEAIDAAVDITLEPVEEPAIQILEDGWKEGSTRGHELSEKAKGYEARTIYNASQDHGTI